MIDNLNDDSIFKQFYINVILILLTIYYVLLFSKLERYNAVVNITATKNGHRVLKII